MLVDQNEQLEEWDNLTEGENTGKNQDDYPNARSKIGMQRSATNQGEMTTRSERVRLCVSHEKLAADQRPSWSAKEG